MTFRELMQYELWSKETTRRVFRPVGVFLKYTGTVLGVLVVLAGVVFAIEFYWLTSGERSAGKTALDRVEELEGLIDCNCNQFGAVDQEAKSAVDIAEKKAWTLRDHRIASYLSLYLWQAEQYQTDDVREAQLKAFVLQRHLQWHSNPELERKESSLRLEILRSFRFGLHRELD